MLNDLWLSSSRTRLRLQAPEFRVCVPSMQVALGNPLSFPTRYGRRPEFQFRSCFQPSALRGPILPASSCLAPPSAGAQGSAVHNPIVQATLDPLIPSRG